MPRAAFALAALLLASAAPAAIAQPGPAPAAAAERLTPRQAVSAVAEAIEALFFDAVRGKAIADELRAAAARGEFDRYAEPRELAVALTNRLRPHDNHFGVFWSANTPPPPPGGIAALFRDPGPGEGPPPEALIAERRANYGLRAVQVLPGNIGYIDLREFADLDFDNPNDPARRTIDAALSLVSGADAVIFDLRDNGGGSPAMVGYLTSAFTPKGADIFNTFHSRRGTRSEAPLVSHPAPNLTVPVYILTSGRTGSAAEAFAYTMQTAKRAVVIGDASAGAANPGGRIPIGGGFAVFISMGSPVNPISKRNWEGTGVIPDVAIAASGALVEAQSRALDGAAKGLEDPFLTENRWAFEALTPPVVNTDLSPYAGTYSGVRIERGAEGLRYVRDRRPAWALYPLGADLFAVRGDPTRRIRFIREGGSVTALEVLTPEGALGLYRREG